MAIEIKVPEVGESITEVELGEWLVKEGDTLAKDQNVVTIESEKATLEVPAPAAGKLAKQLKATGEKAAVGEVIGMIEPGDGTEPEAGQPEPEPAQDEAGAKPAEAPTEPAPAATTKPRAKKPKAPAKPAEEDQPVPPSEETAAEPGTSPAPPTADPDRTLVTGHGVTASEIKEPAPEEPEDAGPEEAEKAAERETPAGQPPAKKTPAASNPGEGREDEIIRMTPLRRTVAKRLVEAQQTMAILTTFNEVDMSAVMAMRKQYQEPFQARHGCKLGLMSFFVKATMEGLKLVPQLNAEIRGDDMVYHRYFDIGVAIGVGKGLVVPVLRQTEKMSFAVIEKTIAGLAERARDNQLKPDELSGGTFTISNGGVYGSMLSTPIINPPQSGILGLHAIQDRPVAQAGQVVIRPMMYLALSYDHRIVDGREAVAFLKRVKEVIEAPALLVLEL